MSRIDDAVKRILRVKFMLGVFENPLADVSLVDQLGSQEHREFAREAVRKSLVLLKNEKSTNKPLLPLSKKAPKILVAGSQADNLVISVVGGHFKGRDLAATTSQMNTVDPKTEVEYEENPDAFFVKNSNFLSYAIVVVGETHYAETLGDSFNLTIPDRGPSTIANDCGNVKCVIIVSGRPIVIEPYVGSMDALVAAGLPGTEGQGVADVLFGDYGFTGKLPRTWFKTVA
ncbi:hypothetical protein SLEP1_g19329 [Rubroshorea leprosula]|nr:hypothetical protein SLEP1_g19329 [Rubroshorea leprosula]